MKNDEFRKIRLSIENADKKTINYLRTRHARLMGENSEQQVCPQLLPLTILDSLLNKIHVQTRPLTEKNENVILIWNNFIEALAAEFPVLVI